jgi:hypothetical protein
MGLEGEILQEQSVHRAFETDMHLTDLAFGDREHADAGKAEAFEQPSDIFLIAGETIKPLRQDDGEAATAGVRYQLLQARP